MYDSNKWYIKHDGEEIASNVNITPEFNILSFVEHLITLTKKIKVVDIFIADISLKCISKNSTRIIPLHSKFMTHYKIRDLLQILSKDTDLNTMNDQLYAFAPLKSKDHPTYNLQLPDNTCIKHFANIEQLVISTVASITRENNCGICLETIGQDNQNAEYIKMLCCSNYLHYPCAVESFTVKTQCIYCRETTMICQKWTNTHHEFYEPKPPTDIIRPNHIPTDRQCMFS